MHLCDHFKRRSFDRPIAWIFLFITLLCLLTVLLITVKNRYAESSRQDRFQNYLQEMSALNPRIGHIEEHLYRDIDEMGRLHQLLGTTNSHLQKLSPNFDTTENTQE